MVVIVDYNVGNIKSILNACKRVGIEAIISGDVEVIKKAKGIILPGVGSFYVAMKNLKEKGLVEVLNEMKEKNIPILGICLGMQILFERGTEIKYISNNDDVYFVHSYMADFIQDEVICYTEYADIKIPAIVKKDNVIGCQFHPEKSGKIGENILKAWKEIVK